MRWRAGKVIVMTAGLDDVARKQPADETVKVYERLLAAGNGFEPGQTRS
jgi:hypothetical protein